MHQKKLVMNIMKKVIRHESSKKSLWWVQVSNRLNKQDIWKKWFVHLDPAAAAAAAAAKCCKSLLLLRRAHFWRLDFSDWTDDVFRLTFCTFFKFGQILSVTVFKKPTSMFCPLFFALLFVYFCRHTRPPLPREQ